MMRCRCEFKSFVFLRCFQYLAQILAKLLAYNICRLDLVIAIKWIWSCIRTQKKAVSPVITSMYLKKQNKHDSKYVRLETKVYERARSVAEPRDETSAQHPNPSEGNFNKHGNMES